MLISVGHVEYGGYWFFQEEQEMKDGYFWNRCTGEVIKGYEVINPGIAVCSLDQAHVFVASEEAKKRMAVGQEVSLCQFCRIMETFNIAPIVNAMDGFVVEFQASDYIPLPVPPVNDDIPF